jgi:hypothetical protein
MGYFVDWNGVIHSLDNYTDHQWVKSGNLLNILDEEGFCIFDATIHENLDELNQLIKGTSNAKYQP